MIDRDMLMKMMGYMTNTSTSSVIPNRLNLLSDLGMDDYISTSWIMERWGNEEVMERRKKGINDIFGDDRQA